MNKTDYSTGIEFISFLYISDQTLPFIIFSTSNIDCLLCVLYYVIPSHVYF